MRRTRIVFGLLTLLLTIVLAFGSFVTVEAGSPIPIIKEIKASQVTNIRYPSYTAAKVEIEGKYFAVVYSDKGIAICPW